MNKAHVWKALCPTCGRLVYGCRDGALRAHDHQKSQGATCQDLSVIPENARQPVDEETR